MNVRLRSLLLVLAVFLLGAVTGGALTTVAITRKVKDALAAPSLVQKQRWVVAALEEDIDLDATQRAQVEAVVAEVHTDTLVARKAIQPDIDRLWDKLLTGVESKLRPEQKVGYARFAAKMRAKKAQQEAGH